MNSQTYQQLIFEGIKGLPPEILVEIVDFIYFIRQRAFYPHIFEEELKNQILEIELKQLSRNEETHLEKEFSDYDQLYPRN
jgi:hypothetical protein